MRESLDIENVAKRHFDAAAKVVTRGITEEMTRFYKEWSVEGVMKVSL